MAKVQTKPKDENPVEQPGGFPPNAAEARIAELEADLRAAQKLCDTEREARVKAEQSLKRLGYDDGPLPAATQKAVGPTGAPVAGPEKQGPLTFEERQELEDLEKRANKGRQLAQPTPHEMIRLGKLRVRARARANPQ